MLVHIDRTSCKMHIVGGSDSITLAFVVGWNDGVANLLKTNPHHRVLCKAKIATQEAGIKFQFTGVHDASDVAERAEDIMTHCGNRSVEYVRSEYVTLLENVIARMAMADCEDHERYRMAVNVARAQNAVNNIETFERGV